eukprot:390999-Rhodomonas_salina.1
MPLPLVQQTTLWTLISWTWDRFYNSDQTLQNGGHAQSMSGRAFLTCQWIDIKTAYMHRELDEEIYLTPLTT